MLRLSQSRGDHLFEQRKIIYFRFDVVFDGSGRAQNIVRGNAAAIAGKLVTPAWPPCTPQNALPYESLQDRFEQSRWKSMARRKRFGGDRTFASIERDVGHGDDCKNVFSR